MALSGNSRFAFAPSDVDIKRSRFDRSCSVKTSFNTGDLIPYYVDEVLPGDTFDVKTSKVIRLQTLITPMMDNLYADFYWFFVPSRLVWEHWKEFNGENRDSAWIPQLSYSIPQLTSPASTGWNVGTIADYMGIPTGVAGLSVNALPIRCYCMIVDEWFRDQNLESPIVWSKGDSTVTGNNGTSYLTDIAKGGYPFVANKYHDYFTSCLPTPQKGPDVDIDLGGYANVLTGDSRALTDKNIFVDSRVPLTFASWTTATSPLANPPTEDIGVSSNGYLRTIGDNSYVGSPTYLNPNNLYADLSAISAFSINDLRLAFAVQRFYEKQARGGSRYVEVLKSFFGVTSPDYRLQRPEYLGGNRVPININQVIQQSESTASSPLANTAGMSLTSDVHSDFVKSFTEHGYIIGLVCVRYDHTYQQGLHRMWNRVDKFDFYWPTFANLGEQPVYNKEIYADGSSTDSQVFGYQEAWADYRYRPNYVTGEMRSSASASLDSWHLGDDYSSLPSLSAAWLKEDKSNVDRVLAVTSSVSNQIFADIYIRNYTTRPMPVYSIPGLIDHN